MMGWRRARPQTPRPLARECGGLESLLFAFNGIAVLLLVFMGIKDDRRRPGTPQISIFRYKDTVAKPTEAPTAAKAPWR